MAKQYDVYIAYTHADKECTDRINSILNKYGITCFQDEKSLVAGMDFAVSIQEAIRRSKIVIVVCSKSAEQSAWLKKEIEFALSLGKTIVPVTDEADLSEFKGLLNLLHINRYFSISELEKEIRSFGSLAFIHNAVGVGKEAYDNCDSASYRPRQLPTQESSSCCVSDSASNGCIKKLTALVILVLMIIAIFFWFSRSQKVSDVDSIPDYEMHSPSICPPIVDTIACDSVVVEDIPDDLEPIVVDKKDSLEVIIRSLRYELEEKDYDLSRLEQSSELYHEELMQRETNIVWLSIILLIVVIVGSWLILKYRKLSRIKSSLSLTADINGDGKLNDDNEFSITKDKASTLQIDKGNQKLRLDFIPKNKPKRLSCFIAGSTALQPERDAIRSTISVVYNRWKDKNFQILSYTYEDFTSKVVENGQQSLYNRFIENEADIAVFIIKGFIGDKTIEEFEVAYNAYRNNKHLSIVVYYFPEGDESESVKAIKTKVQSKDQYWITVANIREMKLHFTDIINTDVWNLYTDEL